MKILICLILVFTSVIPQFLLSAQTPAEVESGLFIYGDALPDAPELAVRGIYEVGVRTLQLINKEQIDILNSKDGVDAVYDRQLTVEVWYPATIPSGSNPLVSYEELMGTANDPNRPLIPFTFQGRALRDPHSLFHRVQ